ncbi:hypothetical protein CEP53_014837 [Fusarium sp. AF-6]|nr:hypothetical protein CEP53_014837 [Fusarium sp. AF-6]
MGFRPSQNAWSRADDFSGNQVSIKAGTIIFQNPLNVTPKLLDRNGQLGPYEFGTSAREVVEGDD